MLCRQRIRVRLCKGAYLEPAEVAFQAKSEVDRNFVCLMRILLADGTYPAIATHDEEMIEQTRSFVRARNISPDSFEFQMLVRDPARSAAAPGGRRLSAAALCAVWKSVVSIFYEAAGGAPGQCLCSSRAICFADRPRRICSGAPKKLYRREEASNGCAVLEPSRRQAGTLPARSPTACSTRSIRIGLRLSGSVTFAPRVLALIWPSRSAVGLWFLVSAGLLYLCVLDQRYRCRVCLRRLRMPIETGSWSRMLLLGRPRIEYICPYGHGTLKEEELHISGSDNPEWTESGNMWEELCAASKDSEPRP